MEMDTDHVSKKLTNGERSLTAWGLLRDLAWKREDNKLGNPVKDRRWLMDGVIQLD